MSRRLGLVVREILEASILDITVLGRLLLGRLTWKVVLPSAFILSALPAAQKESHHTLDNPKEEIESYDEKDKTEHTNEE